ncbi:MAG: hypothetical protein R3345_07870 [Fulvivirga sp.]|nr:hypothetical protein [Fulvivirga sp.]
MNKYIIYCGTNRMSTAIAESPEQALELFFNNRIPIMPKSQYKAVKISRNYG